MKFEINLGIDHEGVGPSGRGRFRDKGRNSSSRKKILRKKFAIFLGMAANFFEVLLEIIH
jgi:hypothetical protein